MLPVDRHDIVFFPTEKHHEAKYGNDVTYSVAGEQMQRYTKFLEPLGRKGILPYAQMDISSVFLQFGSKVFQVLLAATPKLVVVNQEDFHDSFVRTYPYEKHSI